MTPELKEQLIEARERANNNVQAYHENKAADYEKVKIGRGSVMMAKMTGLGQLCAVWQVAFSNVQIADLREAMDVMGFTQDQCDVLDFQPRLDIISFLIGMDSDTAPTEEQLAKFKASVDYAIGRPIHFSRDDVMRQIDLAPDSEEYSNRMVRFPTCEIGSLVVTPGPKQYSRAFQFLVRGTVPNRHAKTIFQAAGFTPTNSKRYGAPSATNDPEMRMFTLCLTADHGL